jgi:hypothetical protein
VAAENVQIVLQAAINDGSGDANDYLKYAMDTGRLYYDSNGNVSAGLNPYVPGGLSLIATIYTNGTTPATLVPDQDILIV